MTARHVTTADYVGIFYIVIPTIFPNLFLLNTFLYLKRVYNLFLQLQYVAKG